MQNPCLKCDHHLAGGDKHGKLCMDCEKRIAYLRSIGADTGLPPLPREPEPEAPPKKRPCKKCGVPKLLDDFPKNKECKDGHELTCTCKDVINLENARLRRAAERAKSRPKPTKEAKVSEIKKEAHMSPLSEGITKKVWVEPIEEIGMEIEIEATPPQATIPDPLDVQIGGDHYRQFPIQPIEFITRNRLGFIQGDVVKRICRFNQPGGKGLQDLLKIKHEIDCLIKIDSMERAGA